MNLCEACGKLTEAAICPDCGKETTPPETAKDIPCAYCGATPTYAVVWENDGEREVVYLCARCDDEESAQLEREDTGSTV